MCSLWKQAHICQTHAEWNTLSPTELPIIQSVESWIRGSSVNTKVQGRGWLVTVLDISSWDFLCVCLCISERTCLQVFQDLLNCLIHQLYSFMGFFSPYNYPAHRSRWLRLVWSRGRRQAKRKAQQYILAALQTAIKKERQSIRQQQKAKTICKEAFNIIYVPMAQSV